MNEQCWLIYNNQTPFAFATYYMRPSNINWNPIYQYRVKINGLTVGSGMCSIKHVQIGLVTHHNILVRNEADRGWEVDNAGTNGADLPKIE